MPEVIILASRSGKRFSFRVPEVIVLASRLGKRFGPRVPEDILLAFKLVKPEPLPVKDTPLGAVISVVLSCNTVSRDTDTPEVTLDAIWNSMIAVVLSTLALIR